MISFSLLLEKWWPGVTYENFYFNFSRESEIVSAGLYLKYDPKAADSKLQTSKT